MEENECLETRDGDTKIGFDGQGSLEELVVGRPVSGHEVFGDGRDRLADILGFDIDGAMVEFTEGAEGQDEIDAADMAGIVERSALFVEGGNDGVEFFAEVDGPVDVESLEVDIDDDVEHGSVLGEPDECAGGAEGGRRAGGEGEGGGDGGAARDSEGEPRGGIARFDGLVAGAVAAGGEAVVVDGEILPVADDMESEVADGAWRDAEVGSELLGVGHVVAIGVCALGWEEAGGGEGRVGVGGGRGVEGRVEGRAGDVGEGGIGGVVDDGRRIGGEDAGIRDGIRLWRAVVELEGAWGGVVVDLEVGGEVGGVDGGGVDALAGEVLLDAVHVEVGDVGLEEGLALGEELLHAHAEAAGGEALAVAVLLVADGACGGTGGASGVLRVALPAVSMNLQLELAAGTCLDFLAPAARTRLVRPSQPPRLSPSRLLLRPPPSLRPRRRTRGRCRPSERLFAHLGSVRRVLEHACR